MVFSSERLRLRKLNRDDIDFVLAVTNDPQWMTYMGDRGINSSQSASRYINVTSDSFTTAGYGLWLVETKQGDGERRIGLCGLIKRPFLSCPDVGYAFLPQGRGQGYATEAVSLVLHWAARHTREGQVSAICRPDNRASLKVLERSGFCYIGQLFNHDQPRHNLYLKSLSELR
ncbi:GNAT family N-acetyltransferase [Alteromonas lipolytica]|nr:GNAT family N-acetyltransferase [Alteromonas lipolytica]GGF69293.1 N-acetyltransferase [Alteromonas lipolytica]